MGAALLERRNRIGRDVTVDPVTQRPGITVDRRGGYRPRNAEPSRSSGCATGLRAVGVGRDRHYRDARRHT